MNDKSDKVSELYKFSGTIGVPFQRIYFLIFFVTPFTSSIFFLCWSNSVTKLLNYSNCSISVKFEMLQYFSWIFELKLNKEQRNQVCQTNQNISKVVRKQLYSCINIVLNKLDCRQSRQQITIYFYTSQGIVYLISQWFPL